MKNRPEATERFPDSKDARPTADHLTDRLLVIPSERKLFESRTPPRVYFAHRAFDNRNCRRVRNICILARLQPVCYTARIIIYCSARDSSTRFPPPPRPRCRVISRNQLFVAPRKQPPRYRLKLHRGYFAPIHIATIRESLLLFSPFPVIIRHDGMP